MAHPDNTHPKVAAATDAAALLSVEQAAALLGIHYRTVLDYMNAGDIPWVKLGRRKMIRPAALDEFINANTVR